ncbi:MAG: TenA family protein [Legionellales bacterium]|nr:TenA family protein [Legionellales bacterium]
MFITHLLPRAIITLRQIIDHPFNRALCDGSLDEDTFKFYLEQDALYLCDFSKVWTIISERCTTRSYAEQFKRLADETIVAELELHALYFKDTVPGSFFSRRERLPQLKIEPIRDYTQHLLNLAEKAPLAEAVASCIPCFWTYKELGEHMMSRRPIDNPYRTWIDSYANESFISSTHDLIQTFGELASISTDPTLHENIQRAFLKSTEYELDFFNAAFAGRSYCRGAEKSL